MEYYSANKKNAFESVLMTSMKLEPIIQAVMWPEWQASHWAHTRCWRTPAVGVVTDETGAPDVL